MTDSVPSPRCSGEPPNRCWFRIGVWGSGACEDLNNFVHCFNCPVYQDAGQSLFDREPPPGYTDRMSKVFQSPYKDPGVVQGSFLVFLLSGKYFAVSAKVVRAVTPYSDIHSVPFRSDALFLGLSPIRGKLRLCYSLCEALGLEPLVGSGDHFRRMLLIGDADLSFVFPVLEVEGLKLISEKSIDCDASLLDSTLVLGVARFDDKVIHVLSEKSILETFSNKQL